MQDNWRNFRLGPLQPSPLKISFVLETYSLKETLIVPQIGMSTCFLCPPRFPTSHQMGYGWPIGP